MRNFQGTFEAPKPSFISAFSICMTLPLNGSKTIFGGRKPSSKLTLKTKWCHSCGCCNNSRGC